MLMSLFVLFMSTASGLNNGGLCTSDPGWIHWPHWLPHALHWPFNHRPHSLSHRSVRVQFSRGQGWQPLGHLCYVRNCFPSCVKHLFAPSYVMCLSFKSVSNSFVSMTTLVRNRTTALIVLFSQYLRHVAIPVPAYNKTKKLHTSKFFIFQTMPVCPLES